MERLSTRNVNPDLDRERKKGSFDTEKLTYILDGSELATKRKRELELQLMSDEAVVGDGDYRFMSRPEKYNDAVRKSALYVRKLDELSAHSPEESFAVRNFISPNATLPISLHLGMFPWTIEQQGTEEQIKRWMGKINGFELIGTYAQTELGHGTHVRNLETTATYDPARQEFILHSPTLTSTKFWPGGLGKTTNHAVVMAQLISLGVNHGVHPFFVQTRDLKTHEPLPGIALGDIGPKFGYDTMDNGFMRFTNHRIPRDHMLMKYNEVTPDGRFIKKSKHEKLLYGSMLATRVFIVADPAARNLAQATTVAVRYSCVRHQSELQPGAPEPAVMEYQTQQYKVLPLLAAAYAYHFTGQRIRADYLRIIEDIQRGDVDALPELHAISAGLKAVVSYACMVGIEQCRLACGGHGYSEASGFPKIYTAAIPACTYEGENTVLLLQTARYLVKMYAQSKGVGKGAALKGSVAYLGEKGATRSNIDQSLSPYALLDAYKHRAARVVAEVSERLGRLRGEGKEAYDAWNQSSVLLTKASEAHCEFYIAETFLQKIGEIIVHVPGPQNRHIASVLTALFKLYVCHGIANDAASFLVDGYLSPKQLELVEAGVLAGLAAVRPEAVRLVDAFDFTDRHLGSILGRYDGNVYENLYKWAAASPLNKTQVHESFKYIKDLREQRAKL